MKFTFDINPDEADIFVVQMLKDAYRMNSKPDKIDCSDSELDPDWLLLESLDAVISYYSTPEEYVAWRREVGF